MKSFSRYLLPVLIALSALSVSASAAFYSVYGLSKLFAGASLAVIVMAGTLEASKLVIATLLHNYWSRLNVLLRTYLTASVFVLIAITSMGIYGFLSSAYQETANQLTIIEKQVEFIEQKEKFYQEDVNRYDSELARISETINTLSSARAREIQVRDTSVAGGVRNTISTSELRLAQQRLEVEEENRREIQSRRTVAADSLQKFQLLKLELESNNELAAELGPLKYIAGLTGVPMDQVVNILLLTIIFVFDPLAVSLVLAANSAFKLTRKTEKKPTPEPPHNFNPERADIIGQNGNDGLHYDPDLWSTSEYWNNEEDDWLVVDEDPVVEDLDDDTEIIEEVFDQEYTGPRKEDIKTVLREEKDRTIVLLNNGKKAIINKKKSEDSDRIRYM